MLFRFRTPTAGQREKAHVCGLVFVCPLQFVQVITQTCRVISGTDSTARSTKTSRSIRCPYVCPLAPMERTKTTVFPCFTSPPNATNVFIIVPRPAPASAALGMSAAKALNDTASKARDGGRNEMWMMKRKDEMGGGGIMSQTDLGQ